MLAELTTRVSPNTRKPIPANSSDDAYNAGRAAHKMWPILTRDERRDVLSGTLPLWVELESSRTYNGLGCWGWTDLILDSFAFVAANEVLQKAKR